MAIQGNFQVSVVFRQEDHAWIAQCLEYDIAAQGSSLKDAAEMLERTFIGQIVVDIEHGRQPLANIDPAPGQYWAQFYDGMKLDQRRPFHMPEAAKSVRAAAEDMRVYA